jgi:hypothetical protein
MPIPRNKLAALLADLDQAIAEADAIVSEPLADEDRKMAEYLHGLLVEARRGMRHG